MFMRSAYSDSADRFGPDRRQRAISIALTIAAHLLIAWLLFHLAPDLTKKMADMSLSTFSIAPSPENKPSGGQKEKPKPVKQAQKAAKPPVPPIQPDKPKLPDNFILMRRDEFAASDIARFPKKAEQSADAGAAGNTRGAAYGPGEGPGGSRLYNAEWYREPTRAELTGYLPPSFTVGETIIACQTIDNYRVDNCRSLGETPLGSGLGRAMRQAAWQFRVIPPRIDGKMQVGSWVKIHISFTATGGLDAH